MNAWQVPQPPQIDILRGAYFIFAIISLLQLKSIPGIPSVLCRHLCNHINLEKDISRLTRKQNLKHERNHEHLRRSRRSSDGRNDDWCKTKTEPMNSAALKKHLCIYHWKKIGKGVRDAGYVHSEGTNKTLKFTL